MMAVTPAMSATGFATPIQTGSEDLRTLLRLLRPDTFVDNQAFDLMREPNAHLASVESAIRLAGEGWQRAALDALAGALETPWGSRVLRADPRAQEVRDYLVLLGVPAAQLTAVSMGKERAPGPGNARAVIVLVR